MSQIKTLNGVQYTLPQYNDTAWGANTGNVLTQYLAAIADVTLQLSGGAFTLTADADFGANFGLKALYLKSETANPASAGIVRLAKTDSVGWRNNANGADKLLTIDGSDNLTFGGTKVILSGLIVNADVAAGAAIAYSKLALTGAILNADLAGSIAYSKLVLTGSIVNGDLTAGTILNTAINASAAIALSKLAALGTAKALQSNASTGFIEASSVTNTELGYLSGVTSAIQTQFAATIANPLTADLAAGAHKITGLAAGTAAGNAVRFEQLKLISVAAQSTSTTAFSTTNAAFQTTNLSATFTLSVSTNRVRVRAYGPFFVNTAGHTAGAAIFIDSTNPGGTAGLQQIFGGNLGAPCAMEWIFSPGDTSSHTYAVKIVSDGTATATFGNSNVSQVMTIEEIV